MTKIVNGRKKRGNQYICMRPRCDKVAYVGLPAGVAKYCLRHATPGCVKKDTRLCIHNGCKRASWYGFPYKYKTTIFRNEWCPTHAPPGAICTRKFRKYKHKYPGPVTFIDLTLDDKYDMEPPESPDIFIDLNE